MKAQVQKTVKTAMEGSFRVLEKLARIA